VAVFHTSIRSEGEYAQFFLYQFTGSIVALRSWEPLSQRQSWCIVTSSGDEITRRLTWKVPTDRWHQALVALPRGANYPSLPKF
jgi:hypothetical protein